MRPIVDIKVVGTDCSNGMKLLKNLSKVEREMNLKLNIEKIEKNLKDRYKIDVIPALIIDGNIVSKGAVLTDREIKDLIRNNIEINLRGI